MIDNQKILYKFIQTNDNVNWSIISYKYILSKNFIRKFKYKLNWYEISKYQILSENFIREFQDKVDWSNISINQKLSEPFLSVSFKIKLIGIIYHYAKYYQKTLLKNSKIKFIGGIY